MIDISPYIHSKWELTKINLSNIVSIIKPVYRSIFKTMVKKTLDWKGKSGIWLNRYWLGIDLVGRVRDWLRDWVGGKKRIKKDIGRSFVGGGGRFVGGGREIWVEKDISLVNILSWWEFGWEKGLILFFEFRKFSI